jgi:predicted acyl esterase
MICLIRWSWQRHSPGVTAMWETLGISYFAMTQLAAAVAQPPHLNTIFPLALTDDPYDAAWHNGLLSSGFASAWIASIGVMAARIRKCGGTIFSS